LGVGAVGFNSRMICCSGFSLYLRYAAVPLQSGSRSANIIYSPFLVDFAYSFDLTSFIFL
jgi:hypothetical protein